MSTSEAQLKAIKKWQSKNYESLNLRVRKGEKEKILTFAESKGKSLNGFIKEAIYSAMGETPEQDEPTEET